MRVRSAKPTASIGNARTWSPGWFSRTGNSLAPVFYLVVAAVVSLAALLTLREIAGRPPAATDPQPLR